MATYLPLAQTFLSSNGPAILWGLLVWNAIVFMIYGHDKIKAEHGAWRTSESTLLNFAFIGGSLGALLACQLFRHKVRKASFFNNLIGIATFHMVLVGAFIGLTL